MTFVPTANVGHGTAAVALTSSSTVRRSAAAADQVRSVLVVAHAPAIPPDSGAGARVRSDRHHRRRSRCRRKAGWRPSGTSADAPSAAQVEAGARREDLDFERGLSRESARSGGAVAGVGVVIAGDASGKVCGLLTRALPEVHWRPSCSPARAICNCRVRRVMATVASGSRTQCPLIRGFVRVPGAFVHVGPCDGVTSRISAGAGVAMFWRLNKVVSRPSRFAPRHRWRGRSSAAAPSKYPRGPPRSHHR